MDKETRKEVLRRTEVAWDALYLSQLTQADKDRCWLVLRGLKELDDENAELKAAIEDIVQRYPISPSLLGGSQHRLVLELKKLYDKSAPASTTTRKVKKEKKEKSDVIR